MTQNRQRARRADPTHWCRSIAAAKRSRLTGNQEGRCVRTACNDEFYLRGPDPPAGLARDRGASLAESDISIHVRPQSPTLKAGHGRAARAIRAIRSERRRSLLPELPSL